MSQQACCVDWLDRGLLCTLGSLVRHKKLWQLGIGSSKEVIAQGMGRDLLCSSSATLSIVIVGVMLLAMLVVAVGSNTPRAKLAQ
jgi:hypothetical protein